MGANQSTQERLDIDELHENSSMNEPAEGLSYFTECVRGTEAAPEGRACNGLEAIPSIQSNNDYKRGDDGLSGGHIPSGNQDHGGGHHLGTDCTIGRSCDPQHAPSILGGRDADGACPTVQEPREQAASKDTQPRSQRGTVGQPSRTQSLISSGRPQQKEFPFSSGFQLQGLEIPNLDSHHNHTSDPPSLHSIRIKSLPPTSRLAIDTILQKRPGINFDLHKKPNTMPPKIGRKLSSSPAEAAQRRSKRRRIIIDSDDEEEEAPQQVAAESEVESEFEPQEEEEAEEAEPKKKGKMTAAEKKERHNLSDRINAASHREIASALETAIKHHLKHQPDLKAKISSDAQAAYRFAMMGAVNNIEGGSKLCMELYENNVQPKALGRLRLAEEESEESEAPQTKKPSKGKGKKCKTLQHTTQRNHQHANGSRTFPSSPSIIRRRSGTTNGQIGHLWGYNIFTFSCNQTQEQWNRGHWDQNISTQLPEIFVNREEANARLLELTHYDQFDGGLAAVTRRHVYEHSPLKLLKVELTLATGEERVLWVEKRLVDLQNDLTKKERSLKKWSTERPALPHYIVECEFMTRKTTETPQRRLDEDGDGDEGNEEDDDAGMSSEVVGAFTGEIELERLPLVTFTDRGLANEHAGALFLRHSAVSEAIRNPLDDFWWVNNAVPIHSNAEKAVADASDALYTTEMYTLDMNTRLGFDWLRVAVYAVDDVCGPLNI
ncbi:hypothetical protein F5Y13DRAFT_202115 [Hypoxylon sp. FL1857]|nr:hypothetical protein F5Y13DRAFT_202115 [Hypoxylon sp. FL1857]